MPPPTPQEFLEAFEQTFATGDLDAVLSAYEPDAVFVVEPGRPLTGQGLTRATQDFLDLGVPLEIRPRHVYVAGDIALSINDYSISGTTTGGEEVDVHGVSLDVMRRGEDGHWRYVIDVPAGVDR